MTKGGAFTSTLVLLVLFGPVLQSNAQCMGATDYPAMAGLIFGPYKVRPVSSGYFIRASATLIKFSQDFSFQWAKIYPFLTDIEWSSDEMDIYVLG